MKKFIVIALLSSVVIPSMAQEFKLGATAGVNINSPSKDYIGQTGFNVGVKGELGFPQVTQGLFFDFGALLSSHGWKSDGYYDNTTQTGMEWSATPYYLSIPVHVGYKFNCGDNFKFFAAAGPYVNIGLFGKETLTTTLLGKSTTNIVADDIFADKVQERFDWGLGIRFGVELYDYWQLSVGYDWGMRSIFPNGDMRNRTLSISCAYVF